MRYSTAIGIDTHAKTNVVCAIVHTTGEVCHAKLSDDPKQLLSWIRENNFPQPIGCVYESGPTGFVLARALNAAGVFCGVVAISKMPRRFDRLKTDKRDAQTLAQALLANTAPLVHIPTIEEESLCHLSHLRGQAAADLRAAKQRVASFLLLTKAQYTLTKKRWTKQFYRWAETYEFAMSEDTFVFQDLVADVVRKETRLRRIEGHIMHIIDANPALQQRMQWLMSIHGIGKVSAFSLICEVYDFTRFKSGRAFAAYIGLVPSENSTGSRVARGSITKMGNSHLRRIIVEAAGCYSKKCAAIKCEDMRVPAPVRAKAEKCKQRLLKRRAALRERGVSANKAKVAIARELCEWIYYIMVMPA